MVELKMPMSDVIKLREPLVFLISSSTSLRLSAPLVTVLLDACNTLSQASENPTTHH